MATQLSRRRREPEDEPQEERGTRRRSTSRDEDEAPTRSRRRSSRSDEDEPQDEAPRRGSRRRSSDDEDEAPSRGGRRGSRAEAQPRRRRSGSAGFGSYAQKRKAGSKFADEFKPEGPTLIKFMEEGPFDSFNQHWINEMPQGSKKSFICRANDDYYDDDDGCPLDDIGDVPSTYSLFNVLDLSNPRKPVVKVWKTSVTVADKLERLSESERTSPLNREDLYFEVEMVKAKKKTTWDIQPVKARDLEEDFDMEPFTEEELAEFENDLFSDRTAVQQVDSYDDLLDIAESLDD